MQKIFKNTFEKALDTYTDEQKLTPNYYTEAHNIVLTADRKFAGATNIKGTLFLKEISGGTGGTAIEALTDANTKSVGCKFKIEDTSDIPCLVYFITGTNGSLGLFYIIVQRLDTDALYYLYTADQPSDYFTDSRLVDTRVYPEGGIDYIYFTDFYNELRQLRCEIPTGASDYFLTDYDLSLQRRGANGKVELNSLGVTAGGSLLSGTYQYAYRMADPDNKKFTKWSSLSRPVHVYASANTTAPVYSSVGLPTNFATNITVAPSPEEAAHFTYYQLAVVENIFGVVTPTQPASLLPITAFTSPLADYVHKSNDKVGTIPITDITVDLAAIQTAKTLAVKQNRLFAGNLKYHSLEVNSPTIDGSVVVGTTAYNDAYSDHTTSSKFVGYFRDEVYRFGIVYRDKFGNKAPVKVLDLNAIVGNTISGTLPDVKFPSRTDNTYSIMDGTSKVMILGLSLDISHHPTWAVGFDIVRAKRKKRILSQTPVIPMTYVEGIGAMGAYPSEATTDAGDTAFPDAQPQKQGRVYTPKNLFWPELRAIGRRAENNGEASSDGDYAGVGEASIITLPVKEQPAYSVIFPQDVVYGATPLKFTGAEKLETIDYAIAKTWVTDFETGAHAQGGEHIATKLSGGFYALDQGDYYFDAAQTGKSVFEDPVHIKDSIYLENVSQGTVLGGNKIMSYSDLSGQGIDWGFEQQPQRCVVVETSAVLPDVITNTNTTIAGTTGTGPLTFANAVLNEYTGASGEYITDISGPQYEESVTLNNKYINEYAGYSQGGSYVQAFRIANVTNDLGDDRYGPEDAQHEFIFTGASYVFTEAELVSVQAGAAAHAGVGVWGGDCFIAAHTFKLNDTWYSVTNQLKNHATPSDDTADDLLKYWTRFYQNATDTAALCVPVAVEGASQFVQLILESEYNGGVMGEDIIWAVTTVNDFPAMNLNDDFNTAGSLRSPLLYKYNLNLSKQDDQRVYFPLPSFSQIQAGFKSRVVHSDIKIYDTDIQGFDVFRVGNRYDLEESRGAITKLAIAADDMYGIQETGVVWLPTGQTQLQQTDAGTLAVGTGDVIGRPVILQQARGGQHLRGIVETGDTIFIPDAKNKTVYQLLNRQFKTIDVSSSIFDDTIAESDVLGLYDPVEHQYFLVDLAEGTCFVWNEFIEGGSWVGDFEFNNDEHLLSDGVYTNDRLYLTSLTLDTTVTPNSWAMFEGDYNSLFGTIVIPRLIFVINPEADLAKTFDDIMLLSDQRLASITLTVPRESSLGDQSSTQSLNALAVEGGYRIKVLRHSDNSRLRGQRMLTEVKWKTGAADKATLSSVLTKYRNSSRTPF